MKQDGWRSGVGYGGWMVVRKCGTAVWIFFPGLFPSESEAQCLPSETWLCFRPDGPVLHLRELHRPRAQLSPSSLFSHLHFLFFASILYFIQSPPPFPFYFHVLLPPTLSIILSYFSPLTLLSPLSHVPYLPLLNLSTSAFSRFALLRLPSFFLCVAECQRVEKAIRWSQITVGGGYCLTLSSWPLVPVLSSVPPETLVIQI